MLLLMNGTEINGKSQLEANVSKAVMAQIIELIACGAVLTLDLNDVDSVPDGSVDD